MFAIDDEGVKVKSSCICLLLTSSKPFFQDQRPVTVLSVLVTTVGKSKITSREKSATEPATIFELP